MLRARALSALVLAPLALVAAWWGGLYFAAVAAVATMVMSWEWCRMVAGRFGNGGRLAALVCAAACLLSVSFAGPAVLVVVAGALVAAITAPDRLRVWAGTGTLYAGLPSVALIWLREYQDHGREVLFWVLLVVWATDIGAYAFGRLIGGPLLAPAVSPKKTWAGLLGGMACSAAVGAGMAPFMDGGSVVGLAVGSAFLAVVAQAGDLFESWVKRRWGVKDASHVIPGHGGVLDRVDGLLAVSSAVALATLASGTEVIRWHW